MLSGKVTRVTVAEYVDGKGLEQVQVDGIPEGFAFKEPDITIGNKEYLGRYWAFIPLAHWEDSEAIIKKPFLQDLIEGYRELCQKK